MSEKSVKSDQTYRKQESEFFIRMLADHLSGRQTIPQDDLDFDAFYRLVQTHQVTAIAYTQCKEFIPASHMAKFEKAYSATLFFFANRVNDMNDISRAFARGGIPFFTVKGLDVAEYYPVPSLRTMGDCDIVVRPEDTGEAVKLLRGIGFDEEISIYYHAWACKRDRRLYELHNKLLDNDENAVREDFFNDFMPYVHDNKLDWSFHFLFLLVHLRKHFINQGVGIRQFIDLAVVTDRAPELRWDWIEDKLKQLDLERFAHVCYSLIENWFGVSAPVNYDKLDPESVALITDKILSNGVFGTADAENRNVDVHNSLIMTSKPKWIKRISILVKKMFPSYNSMANYPGCAYLYGRPYLLPIAWIQRYIYILMGKSKASAASSVRVIFSSKEELKKQEELLEIMGITQPTDLGRGKDLH